MKDNISNKFSIRDLEFSLNPGQKKTYMIPMCRSVYVAESYYMIGQQKMDQNVKVSFGNDQNPPSSITSSSISRGWHTYGQYNYITMIEIENINQENQVKLIMQISENFLINKQIFEVSFADSRFIVDDENAVNVHVTNTTTHPVNTKEVENSWLTKMAESTYGELEAASWKGGYNFSVLDSTKYNNTSFGLDTNRNWMLYQDLFYRRYSIHYTKDDVLLDMLSIFNTPGDFIGFNMSFTYKIRVNYDYHVNDIYDTNKKFYACVLCRNTKLNKLYSLVPSYEEVFKAETFPLEPSFDTVNDFHLQGSVEMTQTYINKSSIVKEYIREFSNFIPEIKSLYAVDITNRETTILGGHYDVDITDIRFVPIFIKDWS